jgi:NTP pyrophosphatase (non-canonical NTP hydrolase)
MNIDDYSTQAISTLTDGHSASDIDATLMAQVLGLVGESGEVAEKFKKIIRDKQGNVSSEDRDEILKELGDILWYVNAVAHLLDARLEDVATDNLKKVLSRKERGQTLGSGDNR